MQIKLQAIHYFLKENGFDTGLIHIVNEISTDTRTVTENDLFIALKGENFDANNFCFEALNKGAALVISEFTPEQLRGLDAYSENLSKKIISVKSSLDAYHSIANHYRKLTNPLCVGITGSSGKTTCKDLMTTVLKNKFKIHATIANYNNEIGVPKTILSMPEGTQVLILEMAMRGLGQIELLSKTAEPNIAIITNIGTAHIELLGSKENIRQAKLEIIAGIQDYQGWIKEKSLLIVDEELYKFCKNNCKVSELLSFDIKQKYQVNGLVSDGLIADINAVALVARRLGMTDQEIQTELLKYNPGKGRGEFSADGSGNVFIDETYNANPEAVRNSVNALAKQFPEANKIVVIGDIYESLPELVNDLFEELKANKQINFLDARGKETSRIVEEIKAKFSQNKNNVILLKASRKARLELVLEVIARSH